MTRREEEEDLREALWIIADLVARGGSRLLANEASRAELARAIIGRRHIRKKLEAGENVGAVGELATELEAIGFPPIMRAPFVIPPQQPRKSRS